MKRLIHDVAISEPKINTDFRHVKKTTMKKLIFLAITHFLVCFQSLNAQEISATSKVTEVSVYRNLAKETRSSSITIPAGQSEIVLTGVTMQMMDQSLQVSVKGDASLLSASVRTNYFTEENTPKKDPKAERLQDSIKTLTNSMRWITQERTVYEGELELINALLAPVNSKEGYKPVDMYAMTDLYRSRTTELKRKLFDLMLREEDMAEKQNQFSNQLSEMGSKKEAPVKEIILSFFSDKSENIQLKCAYIVTSAGWIPSYDIKVENTSQPVDMTYKARIFQNTGSEWKDVKLIVSTSNPSFNNNRPLMVPKYMEYVTYRFNEIRTDGLVTNMMQAERITNNDFIVSPAPPLNHTVPPGEEDIQLEFEIAARQTVHSDNKEHIILMKNMSIPATYKYHAVPKLDPAAFLMARITDYGKYNLLAGDASIFFGDTYIGQVKINPNIVSDTLLISLGREERIVVKRVRVTNKSSNKALSGIQKEIFEYETTIRNNKSVPIEIEILDQIPLTRRKEIVVKMLDRDGGDYNETFGKLIWNYKVKPNESKKIRLSYSVEYPEGTNVSEQ